MDPHQTSLIPVTAKEATRASYRLVTLLREQDEADEAWVEATNAHKEANAARRQAMREERKIIERALWEYEDTQAQVDALMHSAEEQRS